MEMNCYTKAQGKQLVSTKTTFLHLRSSTLTAFLIFRHNEHSLWDIGTRKQKEAWLIGSSWRGVLKGKI